MLDPALFRHTERAWSRGQAPLAMLPNAKDFAFLSAVGGKFEGGAEWVKAILPDSAGDWRLEGQSLQPGTTASAIAIETPQRDFFKPEVTQYGWHNGDAPVKMLAEQDGICFLSQVSGQFAGSGEQVGVYRKDGYWYLEGRAVFGAKERGCGFILTRTATGISPGGRATWVSQYGQKQSVCRS
jgi:hypothetical protein